MSTVDTRRDGSPGGVVADRAGDAAAGDGGTPSGAAAGPSSGGPDRASARALLRFAVVAGSVAAVLVLLGLGPLLIFFVAIVMIVVVHEFGHFAAAKWSHMRVTEYFVGFGPRLWAIRRGETEYGFKAIPAGGYVKIPGMTNLEQIDPADEPGTYRQKPFSRRIIVASAGSFTHLVMALLLAYGAILYFGKATPYLQVTGFSHWAGQAETAAQAAGLHKGDVVTAVDGHVITTPKQFSASIERSIGKHVHLRVDRDGRTLGVTVVPEAGHVHGTVETLGSGHGKGKAVGLVGVSTMSHFVPEGPLAAVGTSVVDVGRDVSLTVRGIPEGISSLFHDVLDPRAARQSAASGKRAVSIIGIARVTTQAERFGILDLIEVLIAVNIAFGLLNMLPMLPLDGGHVAIAVYERIRTRKGRPYYRADVAKLMPVAYAFMAALLVVVVSAAYLDIAYPIANPFR